MIYPSGRARGHFKSGALCGCKGGGCSSPPHRTSYLNYGRIGRCYSAVGVRFVRRQP